MTLTELNSLKHLNRECAQEKRRLASLRAALARSGPARIFGVATVMSETEKETVRAEIAALEASSAAHLKKILQKHGEITAFIYGVADPYGRMILTLRYVNGLSWAQVAAHIGGDNTEDGVRKYHDRHLGEFGIEKS